MEELREMSPEQLKEILEAHRKWVDSEGKEGEKASLIGVNLQGASIFIAKGLTVSQVMAAYIWVLSFYSDNLLEELGLRPHHNETVKKRLAKFEKKKKEAVTKK